MNRKASNLIWIDLEMTGLNVDTDVIIEIALVITDSALTILAQSPVLAIAQEAALLAGMDEWNTKQHNHSGLVTRVQESAINTQAAEQVMLDFLQEWVPPNKSPMCGNSICQDRRFLYKHMPALEKYFHYRNLDVSTLKELAKRWSPDVVKSFRKKSKHLALDDILDSINELKHYREHFIRAPLKITDTKNN